MVKWLPKLLIKLPLRPSRLLHLLGNSLSGNSSPDLHNSNNLLHSSSSNLLLNSKNRHKNNLRNSSQNRNLRTRHQSLNRSKISRHCSLSRVMGSYNSLNRLLAWVFPRAELAAPSPLE